MNKILFLNSLKLAFDDRVNFSSLEKAGELLSFDHTTPEEIHSRVKDQQVVISKEWVLSKEIIERFPPSVKLICEAGTGYNNIDLNSARQRGISVCNVPGYSSDAVAQLVFTFILSHASSFLEHQQDIAEGVYDHSNIKLHRPLMELKKKNLGIAGFGLIGQTVAKIGEGFGMNISAFTRTPDLARFPNVSFVSFEKLLATSDFISLHLPVTDNTRRLFDEWAFSQMRPGAFLVNTARGGLIDEAALINALQNKQIAGAGLDVLDPEPPHKDNPLLSMPNVLVTPHIGWTGYEARQRLIDCVADNISAFFAGTPLNIVN